MMEYSALSSLKRCGLSCTRAEALAAFSFPLLEGCTAAEVFLKSQAMRGVAIVSFFVISILDDAGGYTDAISKSYFFLRDGGDRTVITVGVGNDAPKLLLLLLELFFFGILRNRCFLRDDE